MAEKWRNWSGKLTARPERLHFVRSEPDAVAVVVRAAAEGAGIRTAGSSHSHSPLLPTDGVIVDTSGLNGVISTDAATSRAWVWAGTPIHALGQPLQLAGLALTNQGDIDRQTIAGAAGTGTHGTGLALTNLSAAVTGAHMALASGELVRCSASERSDLWRVAQLSLGAVGLVTRLELQLRDAYRLRQDGWQEQLDPLLERVAELTRQHRHFEFFWHPTTDECVAKATDETDDPPEYPIGDEGARCGWNYEVLPSHRNWLHTEMEYSVPAEAGPACLTAIRELLRREFPTMPYPVEYRTVAPDDVWLSPANDRPTVTISVHVAVGDDDEPLFRACEAIFRTFGGRPHWGKVHYLTGTELAGDSPHWDDWWGVRDSHDPDGIFLNEHLRSLQRPS